MLKSLTRNSLVALAAISLVLAGCAGQKGATIPSTRGAQLICSPPLDRTAESLNPGCGGGGGGGGLGSIHLSLSENGFLSYGDGDYTTYQATGYDTDSAGATQGTASGSTSLSTSDGIESVSASVPSISSSPITYQTVSGWYLQSGANSLPNGVTVVENATSSSAAFTDGLGRTWNMTGVLDSDGHDVDITFNVAGVGEWTQQFDANAFAPTELAATTQPVSVSRAMPMSAGRLPMGWTWGDTAAVAGAVAGVAGMVAGVAALIPGGQGVAVVAAAVAGVAGAVAGVSACVDHFVNEKKH